MGKIKILFVHFDLGNGGAENVLVNLLNNLPPEKYDITLRTVFSGGVNKERLHNNIKFKPLFPMKAVGGSSQLFKFIPSKLLNKLFVRDKYDYEIAYLEDIPTRILGLGKKHTGTKRFAWYHNTMDEYGMPLRVYRSEKEFHNVYSTYDKIAFVSEGALESFEKFFNIDSKLGVVHNVCEFDELRSKAKEPIDLNLSHDLLNLCSVGRLCGQKGFHRLIKGLGNAAKNGKKKWHLYLIGDGPAKEDLINLVNENGITENVSFVGFQSNPQKYVSKMDFFICSSYKEGYSTAVTESIVTGTPVLTTACSGMAEIFGESKCGIIVENSQEGLNNGLLELLSLSSKEISDFKANTLRRSKGFTTEQRVNEFEKFIGTAS